VRTVRTPGELRAHVARVRQDGRTVGLVPTMGAFHDGHLSLMRAAREACDEVVVSLFVNPTQFDDPYDLAAYPRTEAADAGLAAEAGVDLLFAPERLYGPGHATTVRVDGIAEVLEGAHRGPGHFAGVCTVVCKLLNLVAPDVAFFGQKDAQQVAVIRRMVADLDLPARIEVLPTVRAPDGLALSSRNAHLGPADRERATALHAGLRAAEAAALDGRRDAAAVLAAAEAAMHERRVEPEYVALVDPDSFSALERVDGRALLAVAARVGPTRLIDNLVIRPPQAGSTP
jgi:pantoate--beta-alanine ligase